MGTEMITGDMTPPAHAAAFLDSAGWNGARIEPLAGDASFRRYFRVEAGGRRAVLMDAPPPHEDARPFVSVANWLNERGFAAPAIHAIDLEHGMVLLAMNAVLVQGFFSEYRFTGLMVSWSLTAEESFYALAPWLLRGLRRHGPARLLAYAAGLLGLGCALVLLPAPWHRFGFFSSYAFMLEGTFPGRCIEFLGGMYLAWRLAVRPASRARWPVCTTLGLAWWLAGMVAMAMVQARSTWAPGYQLNSLRLLRILLNNVGLVPGFYFLLYGLVQEASALRRLLAGRLFGLLGKASYAFYLLHAGLLTELLHRYVSTSRLVQFGLLNLAAVLLYLSFEKPVNQWLTSRPAAGSRAAA